MKTRARNNEIWIVLAFVMLFFTKTYAVKAQSTDSARRVKNVVYVEVNHHNLKNVAGYAFADSGKPFFDIAIIFAANINYSPQKQRSVLYCNPNVREVLHQRNEYIQPLQQKGIKVLLAILGNHHGAGVTNFRSRDEAAAFARQVADTVNHNRLDGVDIDDEWVDYKPAWPRNNNSLLWLVTELRKLMPGKIISVYDMDLTAQMKQNTAGKLSDHVNYAWQPYYSKFNHVEFAGLPRQHIAASAIDVTQAEEKLYPDFALKTQAGGYGWMMYYNLTANDIAKQLSGAAKLLYGTPIKNSGKYGLPWKNLGDTDPDWEKAAGITD